MVAIQEVALIDDHINSAELPNLIEVGLKDTVTVGVGTLTVPTTVTVTYLEVVPPTPVQAIP